MRSIGADHVIDYTREDFASGGERYDLIYCAAGNRSAADQKRALNPDGIAIVAGITTMSHLVFQLLLLGGLASLTGNRKVGFMGTVQSNIDDLHVLKDLLETGKVVPVIDRRYPFAETAEAIRYLETGRARGKVVVTIDGSP